MNFTGLPAPGQQPAGGYKLLTNEELNVIIQLLTTLPGGATLQSVLSSHQTHPVVPILLALNPAQLQQIQQYMTARRIQLLQQLSPQQPQQFQQQQIQRPQQMSPPPSSKRVERIVTIQPKQSVLVPPSMNKRPYDDTPDWVCSRDGCKTLNVGRRELCSRCGTPRTRYPNNLEQQSGGNPAPFINFNQVQPTMTRVEPQIYAQQHGQYQNNNGYNNNNPAMQNNSDFNSGNQAMRNSNDYNNHGQPMQNNSDYNNTSNQPMRNNDYRSHSNPSVQSNNEYSNNSHPIRTNNAQYSNNEQYNSSFEREDTAEPMNTYDNTQPSDDYPLEPLGVDAGASEFDEMNDMEVETFVDATSSIISVKKMESPVKSHPTVNARNPPVTRPNPLIPPPMPSHSLSNNQEPAAPEIERDYAETEYYDTSNRDSPLERPPISPVHAAQEQGMDYNHGDAEPYPQQYGHGNEANDDPRLEDKDEPVMSDRTIYVKNISSEIANEDTLEKLFNSMGKVRDIRLKRDSNAQSRSAFVEYWNKMDAAAAYDLLHGTIHGGKRLQIGWAVAWFSGRPLPKPSKSLYLGNLPNEVTESILRQLFLPFGPVLSVRKVYEFGEFKGCAFVDFARLEDAHKALMDMHRTTIMGRRLRVDFSTQAPEDEPLESMIVDVTSNRAELRIDGDTYDDYRSSRASRDDRRSYSRLEDERRKSRDRNDDHRTSRRSHDHDHERRSRDSHDRERRSSRDDKDNKKSTEKNRDDNRTPTKTSTENQSTSPTPSPAKPDAKNTSGPKPSSNNNAQSTESPTKIDDKPQPLESVKASSRYLNVAPSGTKSPRVKKYWKPTKNLENYIEAIRVPKNLVSSGLMSTVLEKRGICYQDLNSKGDYGDIKVFLEGPKRKVDEFFGFVSNCRAKDEIEREMPYPIFIISRGRSEIAHINWESPYVLGARSENFSFSSVSFKKGSANSTAPAKQSNAVVIVVVDPSEAEMYRRSMPNILLLILPESHRSVGYARHVVKRMNEGADCDGVPVQLPFFWLCDDNLVQFSKLEREPGQQNKIRKTSDEMFKEAFLHAQNREDIQDYGLIGFLRDDGTAVCKKVDESRNKLSLYKCVLINVEKTRGVNYIPGLTKFEDIAFAMRLQKENISTLKLFNYCFRAVVLRQGGCTPVAKRKQINDDYAENEETKDYAVDSVDELLEAGYQPRAASEREDIAELKAWILKKESKARPPQLEPQPIVKETKPGGGSEAYKKGQGNAATPKRRSIADAKTDSSPQIVKEVASPAKRGVSKEPLKERIDQSAPSISAEPLTTEPVSTRQTLNKNIESEDESSVIGSELVFPDVDPEELKRSDVKVKKRIIQEESSDSSDSSSSSDSNDSSDSSDSESSAKQKAAPPKKKQEITTKPKPAVAKTTKAAVEKKKANEQTKAASEDNMTVSEAIKVRERSSAVAAKQALVTPPKKTPLKGAAVKAPAPPKEKKVTAKKVKTEEKEKSNRGRKRKVDEVSNDNSSSEGPAKKKPANWNIGPDGRRIYCHQCRQPRSYEEVAFCRNENGCKCPRPWCGVCLKNRYGLEMTELQGRKWSCPVCEGHCNCSHCRVLNGKKPTGQLTIDSVKSLGFDSVHHYLASINDDKLDSVAKESVSPPPKIKEKPVVERDIEPLVIDDEGEEYAVDKIFLKRKHAQTKTVQFLVKWHNFPLTVCTWVNFEDMFCGDILHTFEQEWSTRREVIEAAQKKPKRSLAVSENNTNATERENVSANTNTDVAADGVASIVRTENKRDGPQRSKSAPLQSDYQPTSEAVQHTGNSSAETEMEGVTHESVLTADQSTGSLVNTGENDQTAVHEQEGPVDGDNDTVPSDEPVLSEPTDDLQSVLQLLADQTAQSATVVPAASPNDEGVTAMPPTADESGAAQQEPTEEPTMNQLGVTQEPLIDEEPVPTAADDVTIARAADDPMNRSLEPAQEMPLENSTDIQSEHGVPMEATEEPRMDQEPALTMGSADATMITLETVQETLSEGTATMTHSEQHPPTEVAKELGFEHEVGPDDHTVTPLKTAQELPLDDNTMMAQSELEMPMETTEQPTIDQAPITTVVSEAANHGTDNETKMQLEPPQETPLDDNVALAPRPSESIQTAKDGVKPDQLEARQESVNAAQDTSAVTEAQHETVSNANDAAGDSSMQLDTTQELTNQVQAPLSTLHLSTTQEITDSGQLQLSQTTEVPPTEQHGEVLEHHTAEAPIAEQPAEAVDSSVPMSVETGHNAPNSPSVSIKQEPQHEHTKKVGRPRKTRSPGSSATLPATQAYLNELGEMDPNEFAPGMKVWVKKTGYKWWPSQIVAKLTDDSFLVIFYSAESFAEVKVPDPDVKMVLFEAYIDVLGPFTNRKALNEAIAQQHDWEVYSKAPKKKTRKKKKNY